MTLPQSPGGAGELWGLVVSRGPGPGQIPGQTSHRGHFGVRLGHYSKLSQAWRVTFCIIIWVIVGVISVFRMVQPKICLRFYKCSGV
jgi:hypothetical protein